MEALAVLSIASNVIQVVDFSTSIVSKTSELYKSYHGQLAQHTDISTTSSDLYRSTAKLSESIAPQAIPTVLSEDDQALYILCTGYVDVSKELQSGLQQLQVKGTPTKWKSLRKALETIWTKDKIADLQTRLAGYRSQLDSRIIIGIKSRVDIVELRQSEGFKEIDKDVQSLVDTVLDTAAAVQLTIEQRATTTEAILVSTTRQSEHVVIDAVETSSKAHQTQIQSVEDKLTLVQVAEAQNQSLLDLVESIKSQLSIYSRTITSIRWKVDPYDAAKIAANWSLKKTTTNRDIARLDLARLFEAVESGNASSIRGEPVFKSVVNLSQEVQIDLRDLDLQTILFYLTIVVDSSNQVATGKSERTHLDNALDIIGKPIALQSYEHHPQVAGYNSIDQVPVYELPPISPRAEALQLSGMSTEQCAVTTRTPSPSDAKNSPQCDAENVAFPPQPSSGPSMVKLEMNALTWSLFALRNQADTLHAVLEAIMDIGVTSQARDRTGLCAYDHARILKLDQVTIDKLYPFTHTGFNTRNHLIDSIQSNDSSQVIRYLRAKGAPLDLDQDKLSPIALAIHIQCDIMLPVLLEHGFSPFAVYRHGTQHYPSMAGAIAQVSLLRCSDSVWLSFDDWIKTHTCTMIENPSVQQRIQCALEIVRGQSGKPYEANAVNCHDALILSILYDRDSCFRIIRQRASSGPRWSPEDPDISVWPMYAAIRAGRVQIVDMMMGYLLQNHYEAQHRGAQRGCSHYLAAWWPFPCSCDEGVHSLFRNATGPFDSIYSSLEKYLDCLQTTRLCPNCEPLRSQYRAIKDLWTVRRNDASFARAEKPHSG